MQSTIPLGAASVPKVQNPRSTFDRTCGYKTTFNAGELIPFFVDEVLPGDTFNLKATLFGRMATPIFPLMDNLFIDTQFFYVPARIVWSNFERFMGAQDNPADSISYLIPTFDKATYPAGGFAENSIYDYLGLPTKCVYLASSLPVDFNALILRSINLIWNNWYRDENLQDSVPVPLDDGPDDFADYTILPRGKRKDYFTSALPWPQKGDEVDIPLATEAPVLGIGFTTNVWGGTATGLYESDNTTSTFTNTKNPSPTSGGGPNSEMYIQKQTTSDYPWIRADLTDSAGTINELRTAVQLQRFLERDARGGTRYRELIFSHFGVISADGRLQVPEYLGGSSHPINITPIAQNSESGTTPQGNLAAIGTFSSSPSFVRSFTEHGYIIGFVSARADLTYQNNIDRMWLRRGRYDFYWPTFAHLGEQAIYNCELWFDSLGSLPFVPFGYQERYAEYRYKNSLVTSAFRSNATTSLDAWHLAQEFALQPALNDEFIVENPPMSRVQAVNTEPSFIMDSYIKLKCTRAMPVVSVPGLMDHF